MKTLIIASALAIAGFTIPAFAGPSIGSTSFHAGTFGPPPMRVTPTTAPYALKGRMQHEPKHEYRWRVENRQVGREFRTIHVREAVR